MLVEAELHGRLHGLDLGGAGPVQVPHLGPAPLAGPLSWGQHGAVARVAVQVVVRVHVVVQARRVQLLLPPWKASDKGAGDAMSRVISAGPRPPPPSSSHCPTPAQLGGSRVTPDYRYLLS